MKKYCIIIGENNEETSRKVQEALFAVGFSFREGAVVKYTYSAFIFINEYEARSIDASSYPHHITDDMKVVMASYVIAHAAELDGARKPWEVAPEWYRLVTEEERKAYCAPTFKYLMGFSSGEWTHRNSLAWADGSISKSLAVPLDFTFAPIEPEIEVDGKMYKVSELNKLIEAAKPIK